MEIGPLAGAPYVSAAVPSRSNLLRLEHELQTVVDGGAVSRRDYTECSRYQRHRFGSR